jgi:hypothetical protein
VSVRNVLISLFVVLNLAAVLHANRPSWASKSADAALDTVFGPSGAYRSRLAGWLLSRYEHLSGLNNRWEMFSHQSRFNWWYGIQAVTSDGTAFDLDVPLQGNRTVAQRTLFDFREAKYHLNLYGNVDLRNRYGRYLCRQFPSALGMEVRSVRFLLRHQMLLPPQEARIRGTHLDPNVYTRPLSETSCLPRG